MADHPPPPDDDEPRLEDLGFEDERPPGRGGRSRFRTRLGEQLTGLLDPEATFRRGQEVIGGVTRGTKEELVRIFSAEVRNFLDKMDAVDLLQQVVHGLTVDVKMQVRFSRSPDGDVKAHTVTEEASIGRDEPAPDPKSQEDADGK